ncbi:hypothetical protein ABK040_001635 [Willaertia magna]
MSQHDSTNKVLFFGDPSRFEGLINNNISTEETSTTEITENFTIHTLPIKIKKIISGGYSYIYNCIWTEDNKIYLFIYGNESVPIIEKNKIRFRPLTLFTTRKSELQNNNLSGSYEIDYKQLIFNCNYKKINCEIKDIFGNAVGLFFWMENGNLFSLNFTNEKLKQIETFQSKIITMFGTGSMSNNFFIKDDGGNCYFWNESILKLVKKSEIDNQPKFVGCYNSENVTCVLITNENKLFIKEWGDEFKYKETDFEKESKVIDLKCGYRHCVILLGMF